MLQRTVLLNVTLVLATTGVACAPVQKRSTPPWHLAAEARALVQDPALEAHIFRALDAAAKTGTDPGISKYNVRAATVVTHKDHDHVVVGGNTEYVVPEAIHGETSLLNHATNLYGAEATRRSVRFIAFYTTGVCGKGGSCGDCRDYQIAKTDYRKLLTVCGQASDGKVTVRRFAETLVAVERWPLTPAVDIALPAADLQRLVDAATGARKGGIDLFTSADRHLAAAALSIDGKVYRAAGADDAAFHYRYPIGGVLQQAATEGDYFLRAVLVLGKPGSWPAISYRDRQYGFEYSSFNRKQGKKPIVLIAGDGRGNFRVTTFEAALPEAFSTSSFMPGRVDRFLRDRSKTSGEAPTVKK
jgi:hypothetical protein